MQVIVVNRQHNLQQEYKGTADFTHTDTLLLFDKPVGNR